MRKELIEKTEEREASLGEFREAVEICGREVLTLIHERYEANPNPEWNFQYHNCEHAKIVAGRVEQILRIIQENSPQGFVTEKDILLGRLIALSHDRIINWEAATTEEQEFSKVTMRRAIGQNEEDSAQELINSMRAANYLSGRQIFFEKDEEIAREAILATIPAFDANLLTVVQPNLKPDASPVAIALALSDIGSAGLDPVQFIKEGDALFREENLDVLRALTGGESIAEHKKAYFAARMKAWTGFQKVFARGRSLKLNDDLGNLPEKAKEALRELFNKFPESERLVDELINRRSQMTFKELVEDMGYKNDPRIAVTTLEHLTPLRCKFNST